MLTTAAAFLGSMLFGIIFDVPRRALILAAVAGTLSWTIVDQLQKSGLSLVTAAFIATVVSSFFSELMARTTHNPVSVFAVPAIIPLVPGAGAYFTMFHFVKGELTQGLATGVETLVTAGSIAGGVALVSLLFRIIKVGHINAE